MNNVAATYHYRAAVAKATNEYRRNIRETFASHGSPIPASPDCKKGMWLDWLIWRVTVRNADYVLEARRRIARRAAGL